MSSPFYIPEINWKVIIVFGSYTSHTSLSSLRGRQEQEQHHCSLKTHNRKKNRPRHSIDLAFFHPFFHFSHFCFVNISIKNKCLVVLAKYNPIDLIERKWLVWAGTTSHTPNIATSFTILKWDKNYLERLFRIFFLG